MGGLVDLWENGIVAYVHDALVFLYSTLGTVGLPSWGLTIILFTVIIKLITLPLTAKSFRSSRAMQELAPQLKALQAQHKNDREKLMQEQMRLYKEAGVNPVAGCLPMLVQMPVWIALYSALFRLAGEGQFGQRFLWIPTLAEPEPAPLYILVALTGITQWVTQKMMSPPTNDPQQKMTQQIMMFMPIMFMFFAFTVPAGLVLYWVTSNFFTMAQYYFMKPKAAPVAASADGSSDGGILSRVLGRSEIKTPANLREAAPSATRQQPTSSSPAPSSSPTVGTSGPQAARRRRGRRR